MYLATNSKITVYLLLLTVEPLIKDTPKVDKSPFKGQPLKEDNLSVMDKMAVTNMFIIKRFIHHYVLNVLSLER